MRRIVAREYYAALPERKLVRDVITYLESMGVMAWRHNAGMIKKGKGVIHLGAKGMSDVLGVMPGGRFMAVECKRWPNKPTAAQNTFLEKVREMGGLAVLAYCVDDVEAEAKRELVRDGRAVSEVIR